MNIALIEEIGIRVPHLIEVKLFDGKWAIVSEYVKGKSLAQIMKENPDKTDYWLNFFVDLQLQVYAHRCPSLYPMKDKLQQRIDLSRLNDSFKAKIHEKLHQMHFSDKICHGDFNPSNIIITDENVPYLIDWAHVIKGTPHADAAWSWLNLSYRDSSETAKKYLDLFCGKSGITADSVWEWVPFIAVSKSVKRVENERKFLLRMAQEYWQSNPGE